MDEKDSGLPVQESCPCKPIWYVWYKLVKALGCAFITVDILLAMTHLIPPLIWSPLEQHPSVISGTCSRCENR